MSTETTCCDAGLCGPNSATHYFVDAPSDIDTQPETVLERLRIEQWEETSACALPGGHAIGPTRIFDVCGIAICEDCIRDIAPAVAALAQALEEEE